MKKPKTCIFCGEQGSISKEHFWPEWLAPHIRAGEAGSNVSEFHAAEGKNPPSLQRRSERPGDVVTKKIRAVCERCNNGWMSEVESNVKPTILALLEGSRTNLTNEEVSTLSFWMAVKTIVGEHASHGALLTPSADRYLVYKDRTVPNYFRIFLGTHTDASQAAYVRHSTTISLNMTGPDPPLPSDIQRNIQVVCLLVGKLAVCVTAARVRSFNIGVIDPPSNMLRLWPSPASNLDLGALAPMDREGLAAAASGLDRLVASPNVRYGGPLPGQNHGVI